MSFIFSFTLEKISCFTSGGGGGAIIGGSGGTSSIGGGGGTSSIEGSVGTIADEDGSGTEGAPIEPLSIETKVPFTPTTSFGVSLTTGISVTTGLSSSFLRFIASSNSLVSTSASLKSSAIAALLAPKTPNPLSFLLYSFSA